MNRRDAINQIKQFGGRLDRFRKSGGAPVTGTQRAEAGKILTKAELT